MSTRLASLLALGGLVIAGLSGGAAGPSAAATTWGPDVRLVYENGGDIWIAHPGGSSKTNLTSTPEVREMSPALSRDGRYVTYSRYYDSAYRMLEAWVYDAVTGKHSVLASPATRADLSPTEDRVAYHQYEGPGAFTLKSLAVDGTGARTWLSGPGIVLGPQWSADGRSLVYYGEADGARMCRVDRGGYDDEYHAYRLLEVDQSGDVSELAGDDRHQVLGGHEGGGVLAYVRMALPASTPAGYCESEPADAYELVVDGTVAGPAGPFSPSVNAHGDVAYTSAGSTGSKVMVDPAGAAGPQELFAGRSPDWGVAYTVTRRPSTITLNYSNTQGIRANGQVTPNRGGRPVRVVLLKRKAGTWVKVAAKAPLLSAKSRYVVRFRSPRAFSCRLTARYAGDASTRPAKATKTFTC